MTLTIGTMGWNYPAWVGPFYPSGTRDADFLSTYARAFDTVEVDATFYAIPAESTVRGWFERTPAHFTFATKLPQAITHEARFRGPESLETLHLFCDRIRLLEQKAGPVLIQCPPDLPATELAHVARFLEYLPSDLRFAIEFRDRSWMGGVRDELLELLTSYGVALALTDGRWIPPAVRREVAERPPMTDFMYVRLLGPDRSIEVFSRVQVDRKDELRVWSIFLQRWRPAILAYIYLNNHFAGHSPESARMLQRLVGQPAVDPKTLGDQLSFL